MEMVLMFLKFFILSITIGLAFGIGFYAIYNMYKSRDYGFAILEGILLLILLSTILILACNLI